MVQQLLSLRSLTEPIKVDDKNSKVDGDLNELNAQLFKMKSKLGQVQVLTNKPHSVYYIATVVEVRDQSDLNFLNDMMSESIVPEKQGSFFQQVQRELGNDLLKQAVLQMRKDSVSRISDTAAKQFGDDTEQKKK